MRSHTPILSEVSVTELIRVTEQKEVCPGIQERRQQ